MGDMTGISVGDSVDLACVAPELVLRDLANLYNLEQRISVRLGVVTLSEQLLSSELLSIVGKSYGDTMELFNQN